MSTKFEETRRMAIRMPELRKKELRSKLTFAEQQELDKMMAINAETYPDRTVEQYAENVRLTAIKNITYKDVTRKAPLFQRLLKQENTKEYKIHIMNEEKESCSIQFSFHIWA